MAKKGNDRIRVISFGAPGKITVAASDTPGKTTDSVVA
jgi:hypothetical protein